MKIGIAIAAVTTLGLFAAPAAAAKAPAAPFDFNGDGRRDRAVSDAHGAGKVLVTYAKSKKVHTLTADSPGLPGAKKQWNWGFLVESIDLDRDGYADLVVG